MSTGSKVLSRYPPRCTRASTAKCLNSLSYGLCISVLQASVVRARVAALYSAQCWLHLDRPLDIGTSDVLCTELINVRDSVPKAGFIQELSCGEVS